MSKEVIIRYLAQDVEEKEIATVVGCSVAYISQVKALPDYADRIKNAKAAIVTEEKDRVRRDAYDAFEDRTLAAMNQALPFAEYRDLVRTMEVLIKRRQPDTSRLVVNGSVNVDNSTKIVHLNVAKVAVPEIRINSQREVIAVGDMSLAPMDSTGVRKLFGQMDKVKREEKRTLEAEAKRVEEPVLATLPEDF